MTRRVSKLRNLVTTLKVLRASSPRRSEESGYVGGTLSDDQIFNIRRELHTLPDSEDRQLFDELSKIVARYRAEMAALQDYGVDPSLDREAVEEAMEAAKRLFSAMRDLRKRPLGEVAFFHWSENGYAKEFWDAREEQFRCWRTVRALRQIKENLPDSRPRGRKEDRRAVRFVGNVVSAWEAATGKRINTSRNRMSGEAFVSNLIMAAGLQEFITETQVRTIIRRLVKENSVQKMPAR